MKESRKVLLITTATIYHIRLDLAAALLLILQARTETSSAALVTREAEVSQPLHMWRPAVDG